jgi:hypothetical protein
MSGSITRGNVRVEVGHFVPRRTITISLRHILITITTTPQKATTRMKLTIIAPEMVYEHEVDSSMQVQDIIALVEAEVCSA